MEFKDCEYHYLLLICLIGLLLITPISAKVITTKVDDKEIVNTYGTSYTVHTVDFGDIIVLWEDYNQIMINDNITFNTDGEFGGYWGIQKINGEAYNEI